MMIMFCPISDRHRNEVQQECIPVGCVKPVCSPYLSMHCLEGVPAQGMYLPGGVPAQGGVPARGGVPAQRGCTCPGGVPANGGVYMPRGVYLPGGYLPRYFPLVNRMTDRCKNITLPPNFIWGR